MRAQGFEAFGADLYSEGNPSLDSPFIKRIEGTNPYILPFADDYFDCAFSQNIFENVSDYDATLTELARVLKPGGWSLNLFPSRYNPIETHVFVPGGTIFQSFPYLLVWSWFSKLNPKWRNGPRRKLGWVETAKQNYKFLRDKTTYLSGKEILTKSEKYFDQAAFIDREFFAH